VSPALPKKLFSLPEPRVMTQIQRAWLADRKPANIELVLDISGSMNDEGKLPQAKRGLAAFFSQLSPRDRVGLETFSDQVAQVAPIRPFGATRAELRRKVASLFAGGQTSLYDATAEGYNAVSRLNDPSRINAVVLLTDGMDTGSTTSLGSIVGQLRKFSQDEGAKIRIYTIAYGSGADRSPLDQIAAASGGKSFVGDPTQIEQVYRSISSFF
jgi:Ca-activated chloride channel family protein